MSADRLSKHEIFNAAAELENAAERRAFLDKACGNDLQLRDEIENLLQRDLNAGSFLESPAAGLGVTTSQPRFAHQGAQIGPYKLLQQIGEGGFGVVFMAEQTEPVRRKVALKLIKPGMDTRQVIARFEAERQALAVMDHPNIAKVLDAGTVGQVFTPHDLERQVDNLLHAGRPYFVMELVRGIPITQYCDENSLPIRERLELFATTCQAIQHAHTKGIIHRDIKPTNVLVTRQDGQPVVKVIDFGVAKAMGQQLTDKTLFTDFAQMIGTPLYMSPEQAELSSTDIDTRSDIYSLGVLLYELLTGTTPVSKEQLKQAAFDEIRRIICEDEPPKPSTRISTAEAAPSIAAQRHTEPAKLTKLVRGELDWIVMKALEKDRNRRYETASGFAKDVQRYLNDEQVQACSPSAMYRFRKFARRNKATLSTAAAIILALVLGIVVSTSQAIRATKAATAEKKARDETEVARKEAVANLQKAREAVDQMLTRVAEEKLLDVPQMEPLRKALLEDALKFYEQFLQRKSTDLEIRLETGLARGRVAGIHQYLGQYSEAEKEYLRSIALLTELQTDGPLRLQTLEGLAMVHSRLGFLLVSNVMRYEEAEDAYRQAIALWQKLAAERPDHADYRHHLADCVQRLGNVLRCRGQIQPAEEKLREALSIYKSLAAAFPAEHRYQHNLAINHFFLGHLFAHDSIGRLDKATLEHRQALKIQEKLVADWPLRSDYRHFLGEVYLSLGEALSANGDRGEAEADFRSAINHWEKLATDFPKKPTYVWYLAFTYNRLGFVHVELGRWEEAVADFTKAVELEPDSATAWHGRGWAYTNLGQPDKAVADYTKAIELNPGFGDSWHGRGFAHVQLGQWDQVVADQTKAVGLIPQHWQSWWRRGQAYRALKQWDLAISDCAKSIELGATDADVWLTKAAAHARLDQPDQAIAELKQAIAKGFRDARQLRDDDDLAALREREDFRKLLPDLEAEEK